MNWKCRLGIHDYEHRIETDLDYKSDLDIIESTTTIECWRCGKTITSLPRKLSFIVDEIRNKTSTIKPKSESVVKHNGLYYRSHLNYYGDSLRLPVRAIECDPDSGEVKRTIYSNGGSMGICWLDEETGEYKEKTIPLFYPDCFNFMFKIIDEYDMYPRDAFKPLKRINMEKEQ